MNGQCLRQLVESQGAMPVARWLGEAIWRTDEKGNRVQEFAPERFSVRELWEALVGPVNQTLEKAGGHRAGFLSPLREEQSSQAFAYVTGHILSRKVQDAYDLLLAQGSVVSALTTPMASRMRTERVSGFQAFGSAYDVPEGKEYPETGTTDKAFENPEPMKRGLRIEVTEETVLFDQTGQALTRCSRIADTLFNDRESRGMYAIQDLTGYKSYYPVVANSPTQTDLYRASAGTAYYNYTINQTAANALADWTDINNALAIFAAMTDEASRKIVVRPTDVLVPYALWATLLNILGVTNMVSGSAYIGPNPLTFIGMSALRPFYSPFMNDTTTWFIGDFRRQFTERVIWPIQTVLIGPDPKKDILVGYRARYKSQVEADDDKYVVRCPAA